MFVKMLSLPRHCQLVFFITSDWFKQGLLRILSKPSQKQEFISWVVIFNSWEISISIQDVNTTFPSKVYLQQAASLRCQEQLKYCF